MKMRDLHVVCVCVLCGSIAVATAATVAADLIKIDIYLIIPRQTPDSLIYFHSTHVHLRTQHRLLPTANTHRTMCIDWPQVMLRFGNLIIESE